MPLKSLQDVAENSVVLTLGMFKGNSQVESGSLFHTPKNIFVMQGQPLQKDS